MAGNTGRQHKAKATHTGRKYDRNYIGRDRKSGITKYVARMKRRGTYRIRRGISKTQG